MNRSGLPSVLITGAAQRLGAAFATRFAQAGWHVVIHYRESADEAGELAASLPNADTIGFDIADREAMEAAVAALAGRLDNWRALINCASVFELDTAERIDPEIFDRAMQTNAEGPLALAQAYLARAEARTGRHVINVIDQKVANLNPDFFSYTMAKASLAAATRMLAMARGESADRIYALHPGAMLPSFDQAAEEHEISGRMNLLQRLTAPSELADAALFLATGAMRSGEALFVDSGQHLLQQDRDVLFLARASA